MDLDNFKSINDCYGHPFGDKILILLARHLLQHFSTKDIISRLGGDEFIVFMRDIDKHILTEKLESLITTIRELKTPADDLRLSLSVGAVFSDNHEISSQELYKAADIALYKAKQNGKDRYVLKDDFELLE